jgi:parvulin-like peptidyl-prolyl isomerase
VGAWNFVTVASIAIAADAPAVAARVNGQPIRAGEVSRAVESVLRNRPADPASRRVFQAEALERVIDRQLVLGYLTRRRLGVNRQEVRLAVQRFEKRLGQQGVALPDYLVKAGIEPEDLERRFAWQLGWQRYLDHYLTDENLAKFFEQHRRDFDGTEVRAAHVLLKIKPGDSSSRLDAVRQRATAIREEIVSGKLSFEAAAERYSEAPTAKWGGDIGFISRHKTMPEEFARAAFALKAGEVSPPVATSFGVHLIKCLEVRSGTKPWTEVRGQLQPAAARYLFQRIAGIERSKASIEYTGTMPHFKPGTKELAE